MSNSTHPTEIFNFIIKEQSRVIKKTKIVPRKKRSFSPQSLKWKSIKLSVARDIEPFFEISKLCELWGPPHIVNANPGGFLIWAHPHFKGIKLKKVILYDNINGDENIPIINAVYPITKNGLNQVDIGNLNPLIKVSIPLMTVSFMGYSCEVLNDVMNFNKLITMGTAN